MIRLPKIDKLERYLNRWGPHVFRALVIILVVVFILSGVRVIQPTEVGVVTRLGKLITAGGGVVQPGLYIGLPHPLDRITRVPSPVVVRELSIDTFWQADTANAASVRSFHPFEQNYCITGDFNVVVTKLTVKYQISDAVNYALFTDDPELFLQQAIESELVQAVSELDVDFILTDGKAYLANLVMARTQARLDSLTDIQSERSGIGINVLSVEINELIPPRNILPLFLDVQNAAIDKETAVRLAESDRAVKIPNARAQANSIVNQANAYSTQATSAAEAEADRFISILDEYLQQPELVRAWIWNESISRILVNVGSRYILPGPPVGGRMIIPPEVIPPERMPYFDREELEEFR